MAKNPVYIYIFKRYAHAIYVKLQHWPCLASRLRPTKKLAPMFFETRARDQIEKSKNPRLYIYIGHLWFGEKAASSPLQGE